MTTVSLVNSFVGWQFGLDAGGWFLCWSQLALTHVFGRLIDWLGTGWSRRDVRYGMAGLCSMFSHVFQEPSWGSAPGGGDKGSQGHRERESPRTQMLFKSLLTLRNWCYLLAKASPMAKLKIKACVCVWDGPDELLRAGPWWGVNRSGLLLQIVH